MAFEDTRVDLGYDSTGDFDLGMGDPRGPENDPDAAEPTPTIE